MDLTSLYCIEFPWYSGLGVALKIEMLPVQTWPAAQLGITGSDLFSAPTFHLISLIIITTWVDLNS